MDIRLPKILRKGAAKLMSIALKAKTGYSVQIHLNEFHAQIRNGQAHAHIDIMADMPEEEFREIFAKLTKPSK